MVAVTEPKTGPVINFGFSGFPPKKVGCAVNATEKSATRLNVKKYFMLKEDVLVGQNYVPRIYEIPYGNQLTQMILKQFGKLRPGLFYVGIMQLFKVIV